MAQVKGWLLAAHDFCFFGLRRRVDLLDVGVGHLLHVVERPALFVFADELVLEQLLQMLIGIAADVAQRPRDDLRRRGAGA